MRSYLLFVLVILSGAILNAQVYIVNSDDDKDDGVCDAIHCSFREAIIAAEADGVPSAILFDIPGVAPFSIIPTGPFPPINHSNLTIVGESQPGPPGSIVIDFNLRNFAGIGFWDIKAANFHISGIDFTDYLFNNVGDHIFQFGDPGRDAYNAKIYNCAFMGDNSLKIGIDKKLISVYKTDSLVISNCIFGSDRSKSFVSKLEGYIYLDGNSGPNGPGNVHIDSNVFVNSNKMIVFNGGRLVISKNIFGALDTSKQTNFLNPENAIIGLNQYAPVNITDNFFFGFRNAAIRVDTANSYLTINKNRFYDDSKDIKIIGGFQNDIGIVSDNFGRNGNVFIDSKSIYEINIERNNISQYDTVIYNQNNSLNDKIRHIDNQLTCIKDRVVVMDPKLFASHAIPSIQTVNTNQVTGTGNPNDSIVIYSNDRVGCPNAVCEAGIELGRTKADAAGNWILNALYPGNNSISAYQFDNNPFNRPTLYSEFSPCHQCSGQVKFNFEPTICSGDTVSYFGKVYTELNPNDSIFIKGDGVICDTIIIVHVHFMQNSIHEVRHPICYQENFKDITLVFKGPVCDSVVIVKGIEVGVNHFTKTICDTSSVILKGIKFDRINPNGIIRIPGAAEAGCDSIIAVELYYPVIDTSVSLKLSELMANENGASYQWIDCDQAFTLLPNDTSQIYVPTRNGNYAVILNKNGCMDTSSCYKYFNVGINDSEKSSEIKVFPNPSNDKIKIQLNEIEPLSIIIYNSSGQKLNHHSFGSKSIEIDLSNYNSGIYYIQFIGSKIQQTSKFIKN